MRVELQRSKRDPRRGRSSKMNSSGTVFECSSLFEARLCGRSFYPSGVTHRIAHNLNSCWMLTLTALFVSESVCRGGITWKCSSAC